jgi:hypothetical protein
MRMARRERVVMLVVIVALLLATAWASVDRSTVSRPSSSPITGPQRSSTGSLSSVDLTDAVTVPVLGVSRAPEPRLAPMWVLPGLAAALAALCLLRRLRRSPSAPAWCRAVLRTSRANRAPPLELFA